MKLFKMLAFAFALVVGAVAVQAANLVYSDSSGGTTTLEMYVSHETSENFIVVPAGATYTFDCVAYDDGYAEWTITVDDGTNYYECHTWNTKGVFMSGGRDTYWAILGLEPEIFYFYYNYVMDNPPPPPEW